jgi:hypothetical protein
MLIPGESRGINLTSFNAAVSMPYNNIMHLADGPSVRLMHADPSEFEFEEVTSTPAEMQPYWSLDSTNKYITGVISQYSAIGIWVTGGPASGTLRLRVVANYETTPASDVLSTANREPSPSNPSWLSEVNRVLCDNANLIFTPRTVNAVARYVTNAGLSLAREAVTYGLRGGSGNDSNRITGGARLPLVRAIELV